MMEYARKMVLVPEDRIDVVNDDSTQTLITPDNRIITQKSVQTLGTTLTRLDNEMKEILESTSYADERDKWNAYQQVLQRYLGLIHSTHQAMTDTSKVEEKKDSSYSKHEPLSPINPRFSSSRMHDYSYQNIDAKSIIGSVPKKYQAKAAMLVRKLQNMPRDVISWDGAGLVTINGNVIRNSNIIDLVNEAMRARKKKKAIGRKQFAQVLKDQHIPREFIDNDELMQSTMNLETSTPQKNQRTINTEEENGDSSYNSAGNSQVGFGGVKIRWTKLRK